MASASRSTTKWRCSGCVLLLATMAMLDHPSWRYLDITLETASELKSGRSLAARA